MGSDSSGLFLLLVILILGGGYFAGAEISFASVNKIRLKNNADDGDKRAKNALYILDNFDKALTTLLIGNNIMHIGCSALATLIATKTWGLWAVAYSTIAVTVVVFLISEMLPKSFAKANAEAFALGTAGSLKFLMKILSPVSFFFSAIGRWASNLFASKQEPSVTEDELYEMIETITEEGSIPPHKGQLLHSAFAFGDIAVGDVLTVRDDIAALSIEMTGEEVLDFIKSHKYSRLPVYSGSIDKIIGILQIRKYLKSCRKYGKAARLKDLLDKPYFVNQKSNIDELLTRMSQNKAQMAVVTDDPGRTVGIVTVEDLLEELVGEIWDENDIVDEKFMKIGGNRFEISGDISIGSAFELMHYKGYDRELIYHQAIGRWTLENFKTFPSEGDSFKYNDLDITVKNIDHRKITKLVVALKNDTMDCPVQS